MRVALYTETFLPKIDGIVKVACLTLEHFQRRGIDAVIVAPNQGIHEYAGAEVIGVPGFANPIYPEGRISLPHPGTYRRVKTFRPDIMHCFHPVMAGMAGVFFAKWLHVPAVISFHLDLARMASFYRLGFMRPFTIWATRHVFNRGDYVLAPSRLVQAELRQQGVRRVGLWRRGVDAEQYHPRYRDAAMRDHLSDGHPDDSLLLYVGRLAPEKQLEQLRPVLECVPGTRLALIGGGPYRATLESYFDGLPVTFPGYMTGERLSKAYASADMFVFPSAFESFGLVLLEAMASGIPVVSARVGGAQDMITEGESGYTYDASDVNALVEAVKRIVTEPGKLQVMGKSARAHAEQQSWPHMMDELIACYEAILAGQPPPI